MHSHDREDGGPLMDTPTLPPTIGAPPEPEAAPVQSYVEPELEQPPVPAAPNSILEHLRSVRDEIAGEDEPLVLKLAAYDDRLALVIRYPEAGFRAFEQLAQRIAASKDPNATLNLACDTIALCVADVRGVDEFGELVPLDGDPDGPPLRIGRELAELLGIALDEHVRNVQRVVLRNIYSPRAHATGIFKGDPAIIADYARVNAWLEAGGRTAQSEFVGE